MSKLADRSAHDRSSFGDLPMSHSLGITGPASGHGPGIVPGHVPGGPGPVPHSPASTRPLSPGTPPVLSIGCYLH